MFTPFDSHPPGTRLKKGLALGAAQEVDQEAPVNRVKRRDTGGVLGDVCSVENVGHRRNTPIGSPN